jgi:hypothetical protein
MISRTNATPAGRGWTIVLALSIGAGIATAGGGCDTSKLETGYQYRRLGSSDAQRRAYYAPQYSREAAMAGAQSDSGDVSGMSRRRPGASQY